MKHENKGNALELWLFNRCELTLKNLFDTIEICSGVGIDSTFKCKFELFISYLYNFIVADVS